MSMPTGLASRGHKTQIGSSTSGCLGFHILGFSTINMLVSHFNTKCYLLFSHDHPAGPCLKDTFRHQWSRTFLPISAVALPAPAESNQRQDHLHPCGSLVATPTIVHSSPPLLASVLLPSAFTELIFSVKWFPIKFTLRSIASVSSTTKS